MRQKILAEFIGTLLLATVVGSGIMAENMAGGNAALALWGNKVATGAILVALILVFVPISGAHFNRAVTLVFLARSMTDSFPESAVATCRCLSLRSWLVPFWRFCVSSVRQY